MEGGHYAAPILRNHYSGSSKVVSRRYGILAAETAGAPCSLRVSVVRKAAAYPSIRPSSRSNPSRIVTGCGGQPGI